MKNYLFILLLIASFPSLADSFESNGYIGAAGVHAEIADESATGQMVYGGWSISEPGRPDSYRVEMQAEQYNTDLLDVSIAGIHALGTMFYVPGGGKFYIDIGMSGAKFEALGQSASKGFFSMGVGYRQALGPVSIHASYQVDNIKSVGGVDIDRPTRATVGIDYLF